MRQFFKFVFASCLGLMLAIVSIFLLFIVIGLSQSEKTAIKSNSYLRLDFDHIVTELTDNVEFSFQEQIQNNAIQAIGVHDIVKLISHARTDDNIAGIVINAPFASMGPSKAAYIRNALLDFKKGDKPIYAYGDFYGQMGYYLSSVADSVFMNPNGSLEIKGFGAVMPFYTGLLDKLGVKMNVFYRGKYKGATEPYRRYDMSADNKYQYKRYLDHIKNNIFQEIEASRNLRENQLDSFANNSIVILPEETIAKNLVDSIIYEKDFEAFLKDKSGLKQSRLVRYTEIEEYLAASNISEDTKSSNQIAVVFAEGNIIYDSDSNGAVSEKNYGKIFNRILKNDKIKAVVLRVNSPGGSSISSDIIWDYMGKLREKGIYVAVSMGDYAASGGYYIACNADTIFADKNTLTGSIGVFLMYPEFNKLLTEKLNVGIDSVVTNKFAGTNSSFLSLTDEEKLKMEEFTDYIYKQFLSKVAVSRGKTIDEVHLVGEGRIWTAEDALENDLIDGIANLPNTIDIVSEQLGLEQFEIVQYPKIEKDFYAELIQNFSQTMKVSNTDKLYDNELKKLYDLLAKPQHFNKPVAKLPDFIML